MDPDFQSSNTCKNARFPENVIIQGLMDQKISISEFTLMNLSPDIEFNGLLASDFFRTVQLRPLFQ